MAVLTINGTLVNQAIYDNATINPSNTGGGP
jgi:hypothetical protein